MTDTVVNTSSAASTASEHTRRNFVVMIVEALFSSGGLAWTDPGTVLPLFIGLLGGSTVVVGLAPVLLQLGWILPQLPVASLVGHVPERRPYLLWGVTVGRLPFLAFVAYLWLAGARNPPAVLLFLLFGYFSMALGNGFIAVPAQDLIAKSIPSGIRGRFFGIMQFQAALVAIGIGFGVRWALGPTAPHFPTNYQILFTLTAVFWTLSVLMWRLVREPIRPVLGRPESMKEILAGIAPLLRRQRAVRSLVAVETLGIGLCLAAPFYMVYATDELHIAPQTAGVYIWAATLGGTLSSLLWAHLTDGRGPRATLRCGSLFVVLAPALALLVPLVAGRTLVLPYAYALVFLVSGATQNGLWTGINTYLYDFASHEERHRYIAIISAVAAPGALLPLVVGALLRFLPYCVVFLAMAGAGAVVLATAWRMPLPTVLPADSVLPGSVRDGRSREQDDGPS